MKSSPILWGVSALLSFLGALLLLNSALFHWWVSWGPPTERPIWHKRWALANLAMSTFLFALAVVSLRKSWQRRRSNKPMQTDCPSPRRRSPQPLSSPIVK